MRGERRWIGEIGDPEDKMVDAMIRGERGSLRKEGIKNHDDEVVTVARETKASGGDGMMQGPYRVGGGSWHDQEKKLLLELFYHVYLRSSNKKLLII